MSDRVDILYNMLVEAQGDVSKVADPFMEDLNKAIDRYEETKNSKKKLEDAQALADHFNTFIKVWYPKNQSKLSGQEVVDIMEITSNIFIPVGGDVEDFLKKAFEIQKKKVKSKEKTLQELVAAKGW